MRAEPAELLFVGHLLLEISEVGHDLLDVAALQAGGVELRGLADEVVTFAERESEAGAGATLIVR